MSGTGIINSIDGDSMKTVANEKWILTTKELHLGHCKETFRAGAVIELDELNGRLIIDGRRFNDTRDLDVLKRQAAKNPENPWVIPYTKEDRDAILGAVTPKAVSSDQLRKDQKLQVINSDMDLQDPIDIRDTQVSKINNAKKEADRNRVKSDKLEVIRGEETSEERLASLKGKTDINSIAERARIKASGAVKMAVIHDDSLGQGFTSSKTVSLNAGQHFPSREEADAKKEITSAQAAARKKEAEVRRQAAGDTQDVGQAGDADAAPQQGNPDADADEMVKLHCENTRLKEENEAMLQRMDRLEKMVVSQQAAPKRGRKPAAAAEVAR